MARLDKAKIELFKRSFTDKLNVSDRPPFIFAGSGISINYCGIPTWMNLLKGFVERNKGCFTYDFGYYSSKCSGDPLKIASQLAIDFHEYWWKSEEYKLNRNKYGDVAQGSSELAFKLELANYVNDLQKIKPTLKSEIELMSKAVISGILTTNWDNFLQQVFPEYNVVVGQKETIFRDQKSIGELFKIHGCVSNAESLVVTSNDYEDFIENNHYLNAKLLTLFIEFPIIFMGYSLSDPNIEKIFKNLISSLDKHLFHTDKLRDRLFFVEWQPNPCIPTIQASTYTMDKTTIPLQKIKVHSFKDVWEVLAKLQRKLSIKLIRHLQNMVYEFVTTTSASSKILVHGIEGLESIEDLEVVVGFGNISKINDRGIVGLGIDDLAHDIVFDSIPTENYQGIAEHLIHTLITKNKYCPFFKYQKASGNLNSDNSLKAFHNENYTLQRAQNISIEDYRLGSLRDKMKTRVKQYSGLNDMLQKLSVKHAVQRIPFLDINQIFPNDLRTFLKANWNEYHEGNNYSSSFRKCICLLDYIENANH